MDMVLYSSYRLIDKEIFQQQRKKI